jgi:general secretion pathway protein L
MTLLARIAILPCDAPDQPRFWDLTDTSLQPDGTATIEGATPLLIALVAPQDSVVRLHHYDSLTQRQAEAAARLDAASASIDPGKLHVVAQAGDTGIHSSTIDRAQFAAALDILQTHGFDPDHVWPFGLVLPDQIDPARARLGEMAVVRSGALLLPDEPELLARMIDGQNIVDLKEAELADSLRAALAAAPVDLRSGEFAKKRRRTAIDRNKLRFAAIMGAAALMFSLLLAIANWAQAKQAIAREDAATLAAAQKMVPSIQSAEEAPDRIERELVSRGGGKRSFTVATAAVWQSLRQTEGVILRDLRFGADRIVSLTLTAASVDPINRVLTDLQAKGFKVTATPRQEANGAIAAAITVRTP